MRAAALALAILSAMSGAAEAAANLSDPTQPMDFVVRPGSGGSSVMVPTGPILQSTMVSPERKSAVISGKRVRVGDTFEGAKVTAITPYEVRMSRGGRETTLRMLPKLVKEKGAVE
jgi:MSHA biogenesis protein MshK